MNDQTSWVVVRVAEFNLQAELLRGLLKANEIEAILSREGYEAAMGIDGLAGHQIDILVRAEQAERARALFDALDAGDLELDENGFPPDQG